MLSGAGSWHRDEMPGGHPETAVRKNLPGFFHKPNISHAAISVYGTGGRAEIRNKKILDGSLKTEGATIKVIHFLVMSGLDETHGSMGWKILTKIFESNPDGKAFPGSLPDRGPATQNEVGECVFDILNNRLF